MQPRGARRIEPDGVLTFDKLSSVFLSGNRTRDDQPNHIRIEAAGAARVARTWVNMCPAAVYEIVEGSETGDGKVRVQMAPSNCVQCGAITAKGGRLTPPEGGSGPEYTLCSRYFGGSDPVNATARSTHASELLGRLDARRIDQHPAGHRAATVVARERAHVRFGERLVGPVAEPRDQRVAADARAHVAVVQEPEPAEHLPLDDCLAADEGVADAGGEGLVVRHRRILRRG